MSKYITDAIYVDGNTGFLYRREILGYKVNVCFPFDEKQGKLLRLAQEAHHGQKRKDGEDYFDHCIEVAAIASFFCSAEPFIAEIGICHDLFEDTSISYRYLLDMMIVYGYSREQAVIVCDAVKCLSCPESSHTRAVKKARYARQVAEGSSAVQNAKIADIVSNFLSTGVHTPEFLARYVEEKRYQISLLREVNPALKELATLLVESSLK